MLRAFVSNKMKQTNKLTEDSEVRETTNFTMW